MSNLRGFWEQKWYSMQLIFEVSAFLNLNILPRTAAFLVFSEIFESLAWDRKVGASYSGQSHISKQTLVHW